MGTPRSTPVPPSSIPLINGLLSGGGWLDSVVVWGVADNPVEDYFWINGSASAVTINQIFESIDSYVNIDLQYGGWWTSFLGPPLDITITFTNPLTFATLGLDYGSDGAVAYPYVPSGNGVLAALGYTRQQWAQPEGDIGLNINQQANFNNATPGNFGWFMGLYLGAAALGLKSVQEAGAAGLPTYSALGLNAFDTPLWTVMATTSTIGGVYPSTLMPGDILALQYLYGVDLTTNAGNTIHAFADNGLIRTIYDASGSDTLDGSGLSSSAIIDIRSVGYSSVGATTIVAIASGTAIENAIGGAGGDQITGNDLGNALSGAAGNDTLNGGAGADNLNGGAGNDMLFGGADGDALDGGADSDTASYAGADAGVYVFFGDTGAATGEAAGDAFFSIENLTGSAFNDIIGWDNAANVLDGGAGDDVLYGQGGGDTLIGGAGFDTANYATSSVGLYIYFGDAGGANGDAAGDTFSSIESIVGSNFNDVIGMDGGNNMLVGGGGNDTLYGQGGGDRFFGNDGFDTVSYATAASGVYVYLRDLGHATGDAAGDGDFSSIESIVGSNFNDVIGMGDFNDLLVGGGGDDVLYGLGGGDRFFGNDGFDTVSYAQSGVGLYVFLRDLGHATGEAAGDGDFSSIESLIGSNFNDILGMGDFADTLIGGGGDDQLWGLGGNDTFYGGAGSDLYVYNGAGFGADTIMDWQDGADRIDFSRYAGADFGDLALTQEGGSVRVSFGADSILIAGANIAQVTQVDFIFGP